jgi:antirestriction protein ArdC
MKKNVYQIITDQVLELLEQGTVPWHKPWSGGGVPTNLVSKKPYRGINPFLLACRGFASPYWLSFKQAQKLGGKVIKGSKSSIVIFWRWLEKEDKATGKKSRFPLLRYYRVFNVDQVEGIDESKIPQLAEKYDNDPIDAAEAVVSGFAGGPPVSYSGDRAFYAPAQDKVNIPGMSSFESAEGFYCTLFHELVHSTGHADRLNREGVTNLAFFGSHEYSKEELVAEFGAAFLSGHCGIESTTIENSAAYIHSWAKKLKSDPKLIVQAAAQAQKAADHILGTTFEKQVKS